MQHQMSSLDDRSLRGIVMELNYKVRRMHGDLYGPENAPEQGMAKRFDTFLTDRAAREEERDLAEAKRDADIKERHRQNTVRLNWIITIGASLIPLLGVVLELVLKRS